MTLQKVGRRIYFKEAPFSLLDKLKKVGAHWDPDRKEWWIGAKQEAVASALATEAGDATPATEGLSETAKVLLGRATYKGGTYYFLWAGERNGAPCAKLCFRDGSRVFWAKGEELAIVARYQSPRSIAGLREFSERKAREKKTGVCECWCHVASDCGCPGFCLRHHDGCDACGCEN
jgi:hypothetical protein